jgi:hypothetical protein
MIKRVVRQTFVSTLIAAAATACGGAGRARQDLDEDPVGDAGTTAIDRDGASPVGDDSTGPHALNDFHSVHPDGRWPDSGSTDPGDDASTAVDGGSGGSSSGGSTTSDGSTSADDAATRDASGDDGGDGTGSGEAGTRDAMADTGTGTTCSASFTRCGGQCADTTRDPSNCGGCGNVCQGTCVNGGCATSCADLLALAPQTPSGTYALDTDGFGPGGGYQAYCDMTSDGGGWTLALKADGRNPASSFTYESPYWTDTDTLDEGSADLSLNEAKFASFSQIDASAVRLVILDVGAPSQPGHAHVITLQSPASLLDLVSGQYTPTALGRAAWLALVDGASPEPNCNVEGFNVYFSAPYSRARIGMISNNENDCNTPDSAVGFGVEDGPSNSCYATDPAYGVGVVAGGTCSMSADKELFGYVFVR